MPTNNPYRGEVALVTGASSGVGAACARRFARDEMVVALLARRTHRLHTLVDELSELGCAAYAFPCDVTRPSDVMRVMDAVRRRCGPVRVLLNNAGAGHYGYYGSASWAAVRNLLQVNVMALAQLTSLLLPDMIAAGRGAVVNIGSISHRLAVPGIAAYAASKAFGDCLTTALRRELRGTGVHVGVIHPGPVRSEFFEAAAASGLRPPGERFGIDPDRVARAVARQLIRPRRRVYVPGFMRLVHGAEPLGGWLLDWVRPRLLNARRGVPAVRPAVQTQSESGRT